MNEDILDLKAIESIAKNLSRQAGLLIGVYDIRGRLLYHSDNASFLESDITACISRLSGTAVENVIDSPVSAVAMRGPEGDLIGVWLVRPQTTMQPADMDRHLALIEAISTYYIRERSAAVRLSSQVEEYERTGEDLSKELRQNEVITEILSKVESEDDFDKVVYDILLLAGGFLNLTGAFILQLDQEEDRVGVLTEWRSNTAESAPARFEDVSIKDLPFADGLSYTISSDSRMPDVFKLFMRDYDISAGVFLPIFLNDVNVMYLCATMEKVPRHWKLSDAGFLNDVKRVITTILSKRITKNSLASSYAVVESVLENTGCGICVMSVEEGNMLYTNERFRLMFSDLSDKQKFERKLRQTPEKMTQIREYNIENSGIYVSMILSSIQWVDDSKVRLCTLFDITENKEFEKQIEKQANIDELTGIYNRMYFNKELGALLSRVHSPGAYICMNIDGFKDVNFSVGSEAGDSILSSVAKFLLKMSGDNVRVYRIGADEFAIIVKDSSVNDPRMIAESIVKRFDAPWQLPYTDCYLAVSVGVASFPKDGDDLHTVVNHGNIAMSEAKRRAGCIEYYNPSMAVAERDRIDIKTLLRDEVKAGCYGMELYKSKADFMMDRDSLRPGFVTGMHWDAGEHGIKSLHDILLVAKREQVDVEIITRFINEAVGALRDQNDFGYPDHYLAIPFEAADLVRIDILGSLEHAIEHYHALPQNLVVCLTGGWPSAENEDALKVCRRMRAKGIHLCYMYPDMQEDILQIADVRAVLESVNNY